MRNDYVAKCPKCQRVVCWASEHLEQTNKADLAKEVSKWIRLGLGVERMDPQNINTAEFGHTDDCPDNKETTRKSKQRTLI
jgi:hypothetical protein